ncbi:hypothetical protein F5Y12DRAFT_715085 [Xylaria sp. FL1777]|nr:hypothetical protein F5Y12DRAFT_715085 [Xylaria sp. FL1777]
MSPSSCVDNTGDLSSWFLFENADSLAVCNETILLRFSIQETTVSSNQILATVIRGCSPAVAVTNLAVTDRNMAAVCTTSNQNIVKTPVTIGRPFCGTATSTGEHSNNMFKGSLLSAGYQQLKHAVHLRFYLNLELVQASSTPERRPGLDPIKARLKSSDDCDAVADPCGIKTADLKKYNAASNFYSTLIPNQVVCCSSGTLPDSMKLECKNATD